MEYEISMCEFKNFSQLDIPILFSKLSKNFNKKFGNYLNLFNMSKLHAFYLVCLFKNQQGLTLNQLNEMTGCDKSNTSRVISDMQEKDIVRKSSDSDKKYGVCLTEKGINIASKFVEAIEIDIKKTLSILTLEEINIFKNIIEKLLYNELKG